MGKPHKHAEVIKAWADGAEIQCRTSTQGWFDCEEPLWKEKCEYRVKPAKRQLWARPWRYPESVGHVDALVGTKDRIVDPSQPFLGNDAVWSGDPVLIIEWEV